MARKLTSAEKKQISDLVSAYAEASADIRRFLRLTVTQLLDAMEENRPLFGLIHSLKYRMKDPGHLREKLGRKIREGADSGQDFGASESDLAEWVTDLAGCRLLHLHTRQMEEIHPVLLQLIPDAQCEFVGDPFAYVWDNESRTYFDKIGIKTKPNDRLYSSVHYVIRPNNKTNVTCEIQVRTLADEIWGEIDHRFNYPKPHKSVACREQISALAKAGSSFGRLVDSIVASDEEFGDLIRKLKRRR